MFQIMWISDTYIYVHVIFGTTDVCNECADILVEKTDGGTKLISMC